MYSAYVANGAQQRAARIGDFRLIHYSNVNRTQLFNLADNPFEILDQNLAHDAQHHDTLMELKTALLAEMTRIGDPGTLGAHVGINVAFGKPATQSSTFNANSTYAASNGTDGAGSELTNTTHTATEDANPSWEVDLEDNHLIDKVILHNRVGAAQGRLRDIQIEILDSNGNLVFTSDLLNPDNVLDGDVFDFQSGPALLELSLEPTWGSQVRIRRLGSPTNVLDGFNYSRPSDQYVLSLDEVQVFATDFENSFLLGDVDRNGVVNFLDIAPFITLLSSGTFQVEADINQDEVVSFLDISPFIAILSQQ